MYAEECMYIVDVDFKGINYLSNYLFGYLDDNGRLTLQFYVI